MSVRRLLAVATAAALAASFLVAAPAYAAVSLSVDLAAPTKPSTGVGEGFLYGINADGSQPPDQYLRPLNPTAYRGGGHVSRGWIGDGYRLGPATQAQLNSVIAQARRLTQPPYQLEYQVILSDIYGADGGQPSNTTWPCDNGNCANWIAFVDAAVNALQASGLRFAYDIWNEPDISIFWPRGVNSAQYFQMWDTAYREIRRLAPGTRIVGPSLGFTPQRAPANWRDWFAHTKAAATLPDEVTNHNEGDGDDPVAVGQSLNNAMTAAGISPLIPLSSNEFQPADRQTVGVSAWYLARFAQSGYANAMRGNWVCCLTPNLTGILTPNGNNTYTTTGNWWVFRDYANLTGQLVATSGQVNSMAIAAAEDSGSKRAVAIIGDGNGYTGAVSVTFSGLVSVPWLAANGNVNVVVRRIPDQPSLSSPIAVYNQNLSVAGGTVTVPLTFQASHDAFSVYLTPAGSSPPPDFPAGNHQLVIASNSLCMDVNGNATTAGARIVQWTCNGQSNQQFQFLPGSDGYGSLRAQSSGYDVAVSGDVSAAGVPDVVQQVPDGDPNSQWKPVRQSDGSYEFQNKASALCLDVIGGVNTTGQQLGQWSCKNAPGTNQNFVPR